MKKKSAPKKSPLVNGKKQSVVQRAKAAPSSAMSTSAVQIRKSRESNDFQKAFDAAKSSKSFQIPPPSKPSPKKSSGEWMQINCGSLKLSFFLIQFPLPLQCRAHFMRRIFLWIKVFNQAGDQPTVVTLFCKSVRNLFLLFARYSGL